MIPMANKSGLVKLARGMWLFGQLRVEQRTIWLRFTDYSEPEGIIAEGIYLSVAYWAVDMYSSMFAESRLAVAHSYGEY